MEQTSPAPSASLPSGIAWAGASILLNASLYLSVRLTGSAGWRVRLQETGLPLITLGPASAFLVCRVKQVRTAKHVRNMCETCGKRVGNMWETCGKHVGNVWETCGSSWVNNTLSICDLLVINEGLRIWSVLLMHHPFPGFWRARKRRERIDNVFLFVSKVQTVSFPFYMQFFRRDSSAEII